MIRANCPLDVVGRPSMEGGREEGVSHLPVKDRAIKSGWPASPNCRCSFRNMLGVGADKLKKYKRQRRRPGRRKEACLCRRHKKRVVSN